MIDDIGRRDDMKNSAEDLEGGGAYQNETDDNFYPHCPNSGNLSNRTIMSSMIGGSADSSNATLPVLNQSFVDNYCLDDSNAGSLFTDDLLSCATD